MQIINLLLLAGAASAAAIAPREPAAKKGTYYVTGFTAEHTPHSSYSRVDFHVRDSEEPHEKVVHCSAQKVTKDMFSLGHYTGVQCDPFGSFTLAKYPSGPHAGQYYLEYAQHGADSTGVKVFSKKEDTYDQSSPGFKWEYLNVPDNFEIHYS